MVLSTKIVTVELVDYTCDGQRVMAARTQFIAHRSTVTVYLHLAYFDLGALSDSAIRPSVCASRRHAAALSYRHAGCLQLSHVRTADPSADGRRSAASRTAIGGGHIVSPPLGR